MRNALFNDDYTGCRFRFRPGLCKPLRKLQRELAVKTRLSHTTADWKAILCRNDLPVTPTYCDFNELLLEIIGYRFAFSPCLRDAPVIIPAKRDGSMFRQAFGWTRQLLSKNVDGLSSRAILSSLRKRPRGYSLTADDVTVILKSLGGVTRKHGNEKYRCAVGDLSSVGDRLYRILKEANRPMHFRQLIAVLET